MKQTIEYYYNLTDIQLNIEKDVYHFTYNDEDYYFLPFFQSHNIDGIIEYSKYLKSHNIDCHDILLNIKKEPFTKIDEVNYIMLKVRNKDIDYSIFDMLDLSSKMTIDYSKKYHNNWALLWSQKIDYIETQLSEIKVDNIIKKSIDYYIGLAESAIYYVNTINSLYKDEVLKPVLAHKRIYYPNTKLNYLNPISFIVDIEQRDVAEYLKSMFWAKEDAISELSYYLQSKKLTPYSYNLLFARLLYPSYYFDVYEKVVNEHENSNKLIIYIDKADQFLEFLKKAHKEISLYAPLLKIDYLKY